MNQLTKGKLYPTYKQRIFWQPVNCLSKFKNIYSRNKENVKAPHYCPFMRGIHWSWVDALHKGPVMPKTFHVMTSASCDLKQMDSRTDKWTRSFTWGLWCQKQVSKAGISNISHSKLWDVITYACLRYLPLAPKSSYATLQKLVSLSQQHSVKTSD